MTAAWCQNAGPDPAYAPLTLAFDSLRAHDYDAAIAGFRLAASLAPQRTDIRKNLAYTLLKTGDTGDAREEFGIAMRTDPADFHVALEYAFLCYEAKDDAPARKAEARRIFASVRDSPNADAESRSTAATAFTNIDEPLRTGIERWKQALAASPPTFSAHYELAQLAEQRDELELAAASYKAAFHLLPERRSVLLELARVEKTRGNSQGNIAALIAASRGPEPRTAELAREQLPARYPYVYEFRQALELDPTNEALHKELAWLLVQMSENGQASKEDAEKEFSMLVADSPADFVSAAQLGFLYLADQRSDLAMPLLNRVLAQGDEATANRVRMALHIAPKLIERKDAAPGPNTVDPRILGERSYEAGFLKDALRYFTQAREASPDDPSLALKLGWTNNLLHDDATAIRWFNIASHSNDPAVAAEAKHASSNLEPEQRRFRTTVWLYPLLSSRWDDLFGYGQVKTELRIKSLPVHPYASVRLAGDARRTTDGPLPQTLSESAIITAAGVASNTWHGATAWFESGIATSYLNGSHWSDYRGGVSWARTWKIAPKNQPGWFSETTVDSLYISHFNDDFLNYARNRTGRAIPILPEGQVFWNDNIVFDAKRQYWANFFETGPGIRFHPPGAPRSVWIDLSALRGVYLRNEGNPRGPNYNDVRLGIWYAFTK
jgi:tetratricopeptide (TPR) repeat protein